MAGRGITTVIAVLILVAVTLAVASSSFFFFNKVQQQAQGKTEGSQGVFLSKLGTCVKLVSFGFNPIDNTSEAVVRNCGFRELDLANDKVNVIVKTEAESCAFTINSENCPNCTAKLGVGSFATLKINASAVECGSTLADVLNNAVGQTVTIALSDASSSFSASTTFVPEPIVDCSISLSSPLDQIHIATPPFFCHNYTITNNGNADDAFLIDVKPLDPIMPPVRYYNGTGCTALIPPGPPVIFNIPKGQSQSFSYEIQVILTDYQVLTQLQATSLNCARTTSTDNVCSCLDAPALPPCTPHPKCL